MTPLAEQIKRDTTIVVFNMAGRKQVTEDDLPTQKAAEVIEYDDMTDEQKRIVDAGQTIAGAIPKGLNREQLNQWMRGRFHK